jgi:hypothetical protein
VRIHFLDMRLSRWDEVEHATDALVLTFFSDERPLRGAAGLADWRLCGRLSRLVRQRKITGKQHESLMLPPGVRLPFRRIMLFGLGDSAGFDEAAYRSNVRWLRDVVRRAGIKSYAIQPPGRATGLIGARRALDLWLDEAEKTDGAPEDGPDAGADLVIIDNHSGQKEMAEIVRYRGKQRADSVSA